MDFKDHNQNLRIIGKVLLVIGLIMIPVSLFSFFFTEAFHKSDFGFDIDEVQIFFFHVHRPRFMPYFMPGLYTFLSIVFTISGVGLMQGRPWGQQVAMLPAVLLLFQFPIGTALGLYMIYALHVNTGQEIAEE